MDNFEFLEKMDLVDMDMVEHAAERPRRKHVRWTYYASLAACFGVIVMSGILFAFSDKNEKMTGTVEPGVASMVSSTAMLWIMIGAAALVVAIILIVVIVKKRRSGD